MPACPAARFPPTGAASSGLERRRRQSQRLCRRQCAPMLIARQRAHHDAGSHQHRRSRPTSACRRRARREVVLLTSPIHDRRIRPTLTVTVRNFNATPLSGIAFTDAFPGTMRVAAPVATGTTCHVAGCSVRCRSRAPLTFTVSGGTLPAAPARHRQRQLQRSRSMSRRPTPASIGDADEPIPVRQFQWRGVFICQSGALVVNQ